MGVESGSSFCPYLKKGGFVSLSERLEETPFARSPVPLASDWGEAHPSVCASSPPLDGTPVLYLFEWGVMLRGCRTGL